MGENEGQERCHGGCNVGRPVEDPVARAWDAVSRPPTMCENSHHRPARPQAQPRSLLDQWEHIASTIEAVRLTAKELTSFTVTMDVETRAAYRRIATPWELANSRILNVVTNDPKAPPATPIFTSADEIVGYCRVIRDLGIFWLHEFDIHGNRLAKNIIGELGLDEDELGNALVATIATLGMGAIVGLGRATIAAAARGAFSTLMAGVTSMGPRLIAWRLGSVALVRLETTAANLMNKQVVRSIYKVVRPEVFRHTIGGVHRGLAYAQIERAGFLRLSTTRSTGHYGEGVYAWSKGAQGVGPYIDIEIVAGTAVENLTVKNALTGSIQKFVRIVPAKGNELPIRIVGTNVSKAEIEAGRRMLAGQTP